MTYFRINGQNIMPLIVENGVKWQRADADGPNAGRVIESAKTIRDRRAIKIRLDVTCRPLTFDQIHMLMQLIMPEFVTVQYDDPLWGRNVTKVMYSNNITATLGTVYDADNDLYGDLTFPLVEQ